MRDALIIICSRPESSRVREKCFRKVAGNDLLDHIIHRVEKSEIPICLAVPEKDVDRYHSKVGINAYIYIHTGQDESPLHRMSDASKLATSKGIKHSYVIRITHDDPLIDYETMLDVLEAVKREGAGYGVSPGIVDGAGVEVISTENLYHAADTRKEPTEFVSYFVRGEVAPNKKIVQVEPRQTVHRPYRLTMDYEEDFVVLNTILTQVGPLASLDTVVQFCDANPSIFDYNRLPLVSVYTCVNNAEKWILNCADSVMASMDGINYEYIIVDDGSTDKSILKLAPLFSNKRIRIIQNSENLGLASSSNVALREARGKYVMRVDADDVLMRGAAQSMLLKMGESGSAIVYPGYYTIDGESRRISDDIHDPREHHHAGCALMNKSILNEIRYRDGLRHWDSLDLYNRMYPFGVSYVDSPLWMYRRHDKNMSGNNLKEREEILKRIEDGKL